ncbi:MAG: hypothetical protein WDA16_01820 [Candidatus Thermoplasmatota archaeon]
MTPLRRASILLAALTIPIALLAPWTHVIDTGLCISPPCDPPRDLAVPGYVSGGIATAGILLVGTLVLWLVPKEAWGLSLGGLLLAVAASIGFTHPLWPSIVIFGHEGGPAWGSITTGVLSTAALALAVAEGVRAKRRAADGVTPTQ